MLLVLLWCMSVIFVLDHNVFFYAGPVIRHGKATDVIRTQAVLKDLVLAFKNYRVEYDCWPVSGNGEIKTEVSGDLLRLFLGEDVNGRNPRRIAYIEPPFGTGGRGGLVGDESHRSLLDPWGHAYVAIFDAGNIGKLTNPDLRNADAEIRAKATALVSTWSKEVIAYSRAEDGREGTGDDITSWRPGRVAPPRSWAQAAQLEGVPLAFMIIFVSGLGVVVRRFWRFLNA